MLAGMERHGDAVGLGEVMAPHAPGEQHLVGGDGTFVRLHAPDFAARNHKALDLGILKDLPAPRLGAFGQRDRDIERVHLPVRRHKDPRLHVIDDQVRPVFEDFRGREDLARHVHAHGMIALAQQLLVPHVAEGKIESAVLFVARRLAGFFFEILKQPNRVFGQLSLRRAVPQLAHNPGRVPGGAGGDLFPFDQDRRNVSLGEVIERRNPANTAADDDDRRLLWNPCIHPPLACAYTKGR